MAKFKFAPQRDMFGKWFTPEPAEYNDEPETSTGFRFAASAPNPTGLGSGPVMPYKGPTSSADPFGDGSATERDSKPFRFAKADSSIDLGPSPVSDNSTFKFAPGLSSTDGHDSDEDDCDCHGSCSDCATKAAKNYFSPGTKIRHKRTGQQYEMVKTHCITKDDCYCVLKLAGTERECLFYAGEVEAVA